MINGLFSSQTAAAGALSIITINFNMFSFPVARVSPLGTWERHSAVNRNWSVWASDPVISSVRFDTFYDYGKATGWRKMEPRWFSRPISIVGERFRSKESTFDKVVTISKRLRSLSWPWESWRAYARRHLGWRNAQLSTRKFATLCAGSNCMFSKNKKIQTILISWPRWESAFSRPKLQFNCGAETPTNVFHTSVRNPSRRKQQQRQNPGTWQVKTRPKSAV